MDCVQACASRHDVRHLSLLTADNAVRLATDNYGPGTAFAALFLLTLVIAIMILAKLMDFVVLAKLALVAIFPNVATAGIEKRVVTPAIRELDTAIASLSHGGRGLKDWFQYDHRKKQSDQCEDRLRVKVNAHVSASKFPQIAERSWPRS
jgi:hypothetical protein